jgi:hypothetical protein
MPYQQHQSRADSESRFLRLVRATCCPFARTATIAYAPAWEDDFSLRENVTRTVSGLNIFVEDGEDRALDLFVMEIRDPAHTSTLPAFTKLLRYVLFAFAERDPLRSEPLTAGIESLEWNFRYRGMDFFIPTFAPFYPPTHTRYSQDELSAFIVLQPDHSFSRRGINSQSPHRERLTSQTRAICECLEYQYNVNLVSGTPKAIRYVHPVDPFGAPIRWWEAE